MAVFSGPEIINNGLVLHLDAANPRSYSGSGTTWNDLSGNGNNGTLINSVQYVLDNKGAMVFDGTDDYVTISHNANNFINTNYTWSLWVYGRHSTAGGITHNMPDFGYGSSSWGRLGFREINNVWQWMMYNGSGPDNNIVLDVGQSSNADWIFLTIVADYSNTQIRGYYNGNFSSSVNRFTDTSGNSGSLGLGRAGSTFAGWNEVFLGKTSQFSVYNRALTQLEIKQNFESTRGRYGI